MYASADFINIYVTD